MLVFASLALLNITKGVLPTFNHNDSPRRVQSAQYRRLRLVFDDRQMDPSKSTDQFMCRKVGQVIASTVTCDESNTMTAGKYHQMHAYLQKIQNMFIDMLDVKPFRGKNITLKPSSFAITEGGYCQPFEPLAIDEDLHIDVYAHPIMSFGLPIQAAPTVFDPMTRRPVAAMLMVDPSGIGTPSLNEVFVEYVIRVMGFDPIMYPIWAKGAKTVFKYVKQPGSKKGYDVTRLFLVADPAVEYCKRNFGTYKLGEEEIGIELTSSGDNLKGSRYWGDIMAGGPTLHRVVTEATLAVLESTGWYRPDYSMAERSLYGDWRSLGYSKPDPKMIIEAPGRAFPDHYFCQGGEVLTCGYDYASVARCSPAAVRPACAMKANDERLAEYCKAQNYFNPKGQQFIGGDNATDYQLMKYPVWPCDKVVNRKLIEMFRLPQDAKYPMRGNTFGTKESMCFPNTLSRDAVGTSNEIPGCFLTDCSGNKLMVEIDGVKKECKRKGEKLKFKGYKGHLRCPDPALICRLKRMIHSEGMTRRFAALPVRTVATIAIITILAATITNTYLKRITPKGAMEHKQPNPEPIFAL